MRIRCATADVQTASKAMEAGGSGGGGIDSDGGGAGGYFAQGPTGILRSVIDGIAQGLPSSYEALARLAVDGQ